MLVIAFVHPSSARLQTLLNMQAKLIDSLRKSNAEEEDFEGATDISYHIIEFHLACEPGT